MRGRSAVLPSVFAANPAAAFAFNRDRLAEINLFAGDGVNAAQDVITCIELDGFLGAVIDQEVIVVFGLANR